VHAPSHERADDRGSTSRVSGLAGEESVVSQTERSRVISVVTLGEPDRRGQGRPAYIAAVLAAGSREADCRPASGPATLRLEPHRYRFTPWDDPMG
jgi:hypothetical protein